MFTRLSNVYMLQELTEIARVVEDFLTHCVPSCLVVCSCELPHMMTPEAHPHPLPLQKERKLPGSKMSSDAFSLASQLTWYRCDINREQGERGAKKYFLVALGNGRG